MRGKVKWFDREKGYGFIESPSGDVFVHKSAVSAAGLVSLDAKDEVEYDIVPGKGGKSCAGNLKRV